MKLIFIGIGKWSSRIRDINGAASWNDSWRWCLIIFTWTWFASFGWFRCWIDIDTITFQSSTIIIIEMSFYCFCISRNITENIEWRRDVDWIRTFDWHVRYFHENLWRTTEINQISQSLPEFSCKYSYRIVIDFQTSDLEYR